MSESGITRRRFIGASATAAGAFAVGGCQPDAAEPDAAAPPDTPTPTPPAPDVDETPAAFRESPQLAELVEAGELPPLEERLPENPLVLAVREEIGEYGGQWRRVYQGLADRWGPTRFVQEYMFHWHMEPDGEPELVPNLCEDWSVNDDATEYTFRLRQGMHWSDGEPCDTSDVRFWYEDVFLNDQLVPSKPDWMMAAGQPMELEIVDEVEFVCRFAAPTPLFPINLAVNATPHTRWSFLLPEHYLRDFHADHASEEQLQAALDEHGLGDWSELWDEGPVAFWFNNPDLPVISAWKTSVPAPATRTVLERNPYYWKVDPEGNQLPYIDEVVHDLVEDREVINFRVINGEIDCQGRHIDTANFSLFREHEQQGDYRVVLWRAASTSAYWPNQNTPDEGLRELFADARFRQALSVAIDRDEINNLVYDGLRVPRQASPSEGAPEYDPEFETRWAEYDPDLANELLDDMGLTERDGDGFRMRPDGERLTITIEHSSTTGSPQADEHELVQEYWRDIGLRIEVRQLERSLYETRTSSGEVEIGYWGMDRNAVVIANPGRYLGWVTDGPWAPMWATWFNTDGAEGEEPPEDHPISEMWRLWREAQAEPDDARRAELFQGIIDLHKEHVFVIGTVGDEPSLLIAKNNFRNVVDDLFWDVVFQQQLLIPPQQCFFRA